MPARSKSQQRLFGMVQAYNEGAFRGSGALRRRVADLARRVSRDDAEHFARTPHDGLPEKKAQAMFTPEELQRVYGSVPPGLYTGVMPERSERRRTFLGSVIRGGIAGTAVGGLGAGALGAFLAHKATKGVTNIPEDEISRRIREAALKTGLWGAARGAAAGAVVGGGLHVLGKARE